MILFGKRKDRRSRIIPEIREVKTVNLKVYLDLGTAGERMKVLLDARHELVVQGGDGELLSAVNDQIRWLMNSIGSGDYVSFTEKEIKELVRRGTTIFVEK